MYAETLTVTGAARPEFALSLGLGRYFVNPTGALFNPLGNFLGNAATTAKNFFTSSDKLIAQGTNVPREFNSMDSDITRWQRNVGLTTMDAPIESVSAYPEEKSIWAKIGGAIGSAASWLGESTAWLGGKIAEHTERSFNALLNRGYKTGTELANMRAYQAMKEKQGIAREELYGDTLVTIYNPTKGKNNESLERIETSRLTLAEINTFNSVRDDEGMWTKLGNLITKPWNKQQNSARYWTERNPPTEGEWSLRRDGTSPRPASGLVSTISGTADAVWQNFSTPEAAAGSLGDIANVDSSNRTPGTFFNAAQDKATGFLASKTKDAALTSAQRTFESGGFSKGEVAGAAITAVLGAIAYAMAKPTETREMLETTKISRGFGTQIGDSPYFTQGGNLQLNISASLREAITSIVFSTGFLSDNTKDTKQPVDPRIRPADPRLAPYLPLMNKKLDYGTNLGGGNAVGYPRGY